MFSRVCSSSKCLFWLATELMLLTIGWFESMYAVFGREVFDSEIKIAVLLFVHMCLFSVFQLFSGTLVDYYGGKKLIPIAAFFVFIGMVLQILTDEHNFSFMVIISQIFLTFGSSFSFIGVGYLSYGFFKNSGVIFGFAQMAYSISYATFWALSACYELFFKENFKLIVCVMASSQLILFFLMLLSAHNPRISANPAKHIRPFGMIYMICDVVTTRKVWIISAIGGIEFGIFFATSAMLLYKATGDIGGISSMCSWIGFAAGAPLLCCVHSFLGIKSKHIFFFSGVAQSICLMLAVLSTQHVLGGDYYHVLHADIIHCVAATLFGFASGAHMVVFSVCEHLVRKEHVTTYYAVVNGSMCVASGVVVLALTALAKFFLLLDLLFTVAIIALVLYTLLIALLHVNSKNVEFHW